MVVEILWATISSMIWLSLPWFTNWLRVSIFEGFEVVGLGIEGFDVVGLRVEGFEVIGLDLKIGSKRDGLIINAK